MGGTGATKLRQEEKDRSMSPAMCIILAIVTALLVAMAGVYGHLS
jgi:hypothetical protein